MSSTVSPTAWLQATVGRSVHAAALPPTNGRHRAPEMPGVVELLTSEQIAAGPGRHAAPERTRAAVDRLGVQAAQN